jgi:hypothetical protein
MTAAASNADDCSHKNFCCNTGRKSVGTYWQGRKVTAAQDYGRPSVEALHLIRKLRWMGMEEDAERLQMKLRDTTPAGGIITTTRETD